MGITTSHQNRRVWGRSLCICMVQVTDVCALDLKVPVLVVTHIHITDIYCFQYKLFKKCQETSCLCTLTEAFNVCAAKSSTEGVRFSVCCHSFHAPYQSCITSGCSFSSAALDQHSRLDTPGPGMDHAACLAP